MSLRFMGRAVYQAASRLTQGIRDQSSSGIKSLRDSKQARRFSGALDSPAKRDGKVYKRAEESLWTVMFLSCNWGPY
ncbi:hypothetical protein ACJRO7_017436 [Eucalyptus globulus]|uniref:Uncharacterized protein n=1 Tax=Eucalyptus globulus TaxID=34317 RepID=A0ABD3KQB8_EUCGL